MLNVNNAAAVASIILRIPKQFMASFPSLKPAFRMSDNGTEARHCEITVSEWLAILQTPPSSSMQFGLGRWWSMPEAFILDMACALLPWWKLVARSVASDYCESV
jgi:hypothetical protein